MIIVKQCYDDEFPPYGICHSALTSMAFTALKTCRVGSRRGAPGGGRAGKARMATGGPAREAGGEGDGGWGGRGPCNASTATGGLSSFKPWHVCATIVYFKPFDEVTSIVN